jgi:hypothetical protein
MFCPYMNDPLPTWLGSSLTVPPFVHTAPATLVFFVFLKYLGLLCFVTLTLLSGVTSPLFS